MSLHPYSGNPTFYEEEYTFTLINKWYDYNEYKLE